MRMAGATRALVPISESDFGAIRDAKAALLQCLAIEEKFDLVVENFLEFEMTLLMSAQAHLALRHTDDHRFDAERALFNRRLTNLLTAVKTYVEQIPKHVASVRPESSGAIKAAMDREYSERLGYRSMLALRNYVQHHDSLVRLVTYGSKLPPGSPGTAIAFTVDPYVRPTDLSSDDGVRSRDKKVFVELEDFGEKVEIKPLVRDCVEGLWAVHSRVRTEVASRIEEFEIVLQSAEATYRASCPEEETTLGLAAVMRGRDGADDGEVQVYSKFNEYRRYLETKNCALDGLARRYVTSEASEQKP